VYSRRGLQRRGTARGPRFLLPHVGYLAWLLKIGEWPELSSHEFAFRMLKEVLLVSVNLFF
jgi:hypothetical protein